MSVFGLKPHFLRYGVSLSRISLYLHSHESQVTDCRTVQLLRRLQSANMKKYSLILTTSALQSYHPILVGMPFDQEMLGQHHQLTSVSMITILNIIIISISFSKTSQDCHKHISVSTYYSNRHTCTTVNTSQ